MEQAQHSKSRDILLITFGTLLVALGDHFFKFPNNFSTGGVTGLAVVVSKLIPGVTIGSFVFVVNMALLVVAFLFLSRKFGLATIYASSLMSSVIWAM